MFNTLDRLQLLLQINIHSPINRGTPTALKPSNDNFQLAQINIVQQAFKEQCAK
jgi:hypothetical protein